MTDMIEQIARAIIMGSAGERAANHAQEFVTANWEDAKRSAQAILPLIEAAVLAEREAPELLTVDEQRDLLAEAEQLWRDLQSNELGGFSEGNRPFWIMHQFKRAIEKYGRRDVGLNWSKNDLEAVRAKLEAEHAD